MDYYTKRAFQNMVGTLQRESDNFVRMSNTIETVSQVMDEFASVLSALKHDIQDALDADNVNSLMDDE